jgi:hypothetical protein
MVTILNGRKIDKESYDIFLKTLIPTVYIDQIDTDMTKKIQN